MDRRDIFLSEAATRWAGAVSQVTGGSSPDRVTWHDHHSMLAVLSPFMGHGLNHALFPTGGGLDFLDASLGIEPRSFFFQVGEKVGELVMPLSLTLEVFPKNLQESFLILELMTIPETGIYDYALSGSEELVEIHPGQYAKRAVWDNGNLGEDEDGREIPLPAQARLITRWLGGRIMIVAKGSIWNSIPETYDGQHNVMSNQQIRNAIEKRL